MKNQAVMVGVEDRVEIWNERDWQVAKAKGEKAGEELAEKLAK